MHFHHWREGNLPSNSKCYGCRKTCWSGDCLTGYRCEWCGMTVSALANMPSVSQHALRGPQHAAVESSSYSYFDVTGSFELSRKSTCGMPVWDPEDDIPPTLLCHRSTSGIPHRDNPQLFQISRPKYASRHLSVSAQNLEGTMLPE